MNKFITFFDNFLDIMKFNSIVYIYISHFFLWYIIKVLLSIVKKYIQ